MQPGQDGPGTERRSLLRTFGLGAAAVGALGSGLIPASARASSEGVTDVDILNFALNLEYLEAEFYLHAVYGHGLWAKHTSGTGTPGPVIGGSKVPFTDKDVEMYAHEIAHDERNHVLFLRAALGPKAVAQPKIDLASSFTVLARAAGVVGPNDTFNPFASDENFLLGAFIFEDVGVTAYSGAAPSIKSADYLAAAAGILAVEAYHASEVRLQLFQRGLYGPAAKISALRAKLSGAADDQGVGNANHANIVPTDKNSLAFARTPSQVLNIVYGGGSGSDYLFFPDKLNGAIS